MSLENVQNFLLVATINPVVANHIADVIAGKTGKEAAQQFAALGCGEGFDFTSDEALEALKRPIPAQLTDDELEKICGGAGENAYVGWLSSAAAAAESAAGQASAAASAFEAAFGANVPPAVLSANRAALTGLIATNFFGQNSPAIAGLDGKP